MTLNLEKNQTIELNLVKADLEKVKLACGWDTAKRDMDLDISANAICGDKVLPVYFGNKSPIPSFWLDGDNLTGEGAGDDENITVDLSTIVSDLQGLEKIDLYINIYNAESRSQSFSDVKNGYVRLVDLKTNQELLRYNISETGGRYTSLKVASLNYNKDTNTFSFTAIGDYGNQSINDIQRSYGKTIVEKPNVNTSTRKKLFGLF